MRDLAKMRQHFTNRANARFGYNAPAFYKPEGSYGFSLEFVHFLGKIRMHDAVFRPEGSFQTDAGLLSGDSLIQLYENARKSCDRV
jgi:hypothetical protein